MINYYRRMDPDVVLLNSTGIMDDQQLKVYGYNTYKRNKESEFNAGIAIAVKNTVEHRLWDDFSEDVLAVEIITKRGEKPNSCPPPLYGHISINISSFPQRFRDTQNPPQLIHIVC